MYLIGAASGLAAAPNDFQFGACVHLALDRSDTETVDRLLQDLGMNSIRDDIYWSSIERTHGRFNLPAKLRVVRDAFAANARSGGTPLAILSFGNALYDHGGLIVSDQGIEAFNRYVRFVVKEYGGTVKQYEVWNEWNSGFGSKPKVNHGDAAQYARLLKSVYATIKSIQPEATVVGGAVAGVDLKWIDALIDHGGLDAMDALSIHSYTLFRMFDVPEGAISSLAKVQAHLRSARPNRSIPIFITEMGWPTNQGRYGIEEKMAASYLTRFVLMARSQDWIKGVWWYDLIDDGDNPSSMEHRFGLVRRNGEVKPAYLAARQLTPIVLGGSKFSMYRIGQSGLAVRFELDGVSWLAAWRVATAAAVWPGTMPDAPRAAQAVEHATRLLAADGIPAFWVLRSGRWVPAPALPTRPAMPIDRTSPHTES